MRLLPECVQPGHKEPISQLFRPPPPPALDDTLVPPAGVTFLMTEVRAPPSGTHAAPPVTPPPPSPAQANRFLPATPKEHDFTTADRRSAAGWRDNIIRHSITPSSHAAYTVTYQHAAWIPSKGLDAGQVAEQAILFTAWGNST